MIWEKWWTYDGISGNVAQNIKLIIFFIRLELFNLLTIDIYFLLFNFMSGPSFWGLINPDWNLCNSGKRQSPINIDPKSILYDPGLTEISVDDTKVIIHLK